MFWHSIRQGSDQQHAAELLLPFNRLDYWDDKLLYDKELDKVDLEDVRIWAKSSLE